MNIYDLPLGQLIIITPHSIANINWQLDMIEVAEIANLILKE